MDDINLRYMTPDDNVLLFSSAPIDSVFIEAPKLNSSTSNGGFIFTNGYSKTVSYTAYLYCCHTIDWQQYLMWLYYHHIVVIEGMM